MQRVLVTRPRAQANDFAAKLRSAGFEAVFFPVLKIQPIENNPALDEALEKLNCYEWVVFTSVNGVNIVFERLFFLTPNHFPLGEGQKVRFAAIGPKTAKALQVHGVTPDFVPKEYVAEAILSGLGDLQDKWVLLPRAELARKALSEAIVNTGGIAHEIAVYKTLPVKPDSNGLAALKSGVDWITFTSPSTVRNFVAIVRKQKMDPLRLEGNPKIACIGPITEDAAREEGFHVDLVAEKYTTEGLVSALQSA